MCNTPYQDFTLLVDGKEAFPAILDAIAGAKRSLVINMFIWRDDAIGNRMAEAVLAAAERGVQVQISVDRYGVVLEHSDETRTSFFHKRVTLAERIKSAFLSLCYPMQGTPRRVCDKESPLYLAILSHPNIKVEKDVFKADHSKFYIIDDEVLFLGGVNIEDKENGADMQGRIYQDYMIRLDGKTHVDAFLAKRSTGIDADADYIFEPSAEELMSNLVPYAVKIQMYEILLDNTTSEHAARTVAMQTASDNANDLLDELRLTYNKRRQQAITDELADITSHE